jgi:hypothetical protein
MQRRRVLGSLTALSAVGLARDASAQTSSPVSMVPETYARFENWLAAARAASLEYVNTRAGREPSHLISFLAMWGAAMPRDIRQWTTAWAELPGANARLEFNTLAPGRPYVVSAFRMAPGCLIPAHCHPGGGGVTMCLEGSITLEHFNLDPEAPHFREAGREVAVRYDSVAFLTQGRYTAFTPTISNLHQLRAGPEGAIGVDLVVQWEGDGEFSFLKFTETPGSQERRIGRTVTGLWTGMNIADAYTRSM